MHKNKSQAALEFLTTYAWAFLVIIIMIGALAYFGVLNPDRFLPNKCTLQAGIACLDHKATPNAVTIYAQNSLGRDITVSKVEAGDCTPAPAAQLGVVANGGNGNYNLCCGATCPGGASAGIIGSKYSGKVNITYTVVDTGVEHMNQGDITTAVEK